MSQIYNEPLLDKIISENTEKLERITEISKKYFEHFLILVNLSGSTKRHVILQQLPMDVTIVYVEQLSSISNTESSFITQVKELGDAIYLEELTRLERKAAYITPNLALLMDSKLFYASDKKLEKNYHQCKQDAQRKLDFPFTREDYNRAFEYVKFAEYHFSVCMTKNDVSDVRKAAANFLCSIEDALALLNKTYWHLNLACLNQELQALKLKPKKIMELIENLMAAMTAKDIQNAAVALMKEIYSIFSTAYNSLKEPLDISGAKSKIRLFTNFCEDIKHRIEYAASFPDNK